jgi:hypothetical protein
MQSLLKAGCLDGQAAAGTDWQEQCAVLGGQLLPVVAECIGLLLPLQAGSGGQVAQQ